MSMDTLGKGHEPSMGKPQFASHAWLEPIVVVSIMLGSCYLNRRKRYAILGKTEYQSLLDQPRTSYDGTATPPSTGTSASDYDSQYDVSPKYLPKRRYICGIPFHTPNSSRFINHYHSRFIQKFPFLVEMFYWALNYGFYSCTKFLAAMLFSTDGLWEVAESHGIAVLHAEHTAWTRIFFPLTEVGVQHFFMNGHESILTFLNRAYSLVHIPGTVFFISWYYFSAPNHATFAIARRTMTLCNFIAFSVFSVWPCMPPRLLPEKFGFHDTVRHDNAQSVWQSGKYVNQLAAMPSLHFSYAFTIGCTLIYHSAVFRRRSELTPSRAKQALYVLLGIFYPTLVLTVIVATANHYWLDAVAGFFVVLFAFLCNRVFLVLLPLEDLFLWCTRLEKPVPTTGENNGANVRDKVIGHGRKPSWYRGPDVV